MLRHLETHFPSFAIVYIMHVQLPCSYTFILHFIESHVQSQANNVLYELFKFPFSRVINTQEIGLKYDKIRTALMMMSMSDGEDIIVRKTAVD